jgi:hypothetical protein
LEIGAEELEMGQPSKADAEFKEQFPYLTDKERFLIGWPGYRTRADKSGLAYVETQAEWGHMQGVMFRHMLTGKFKTRNPVYLVLLTVYGLSAASPLLLLFGGPEARWAFLYNIFNIVPSVLIGVLILVNVVLALIRCEDGESITGD